MATRASLPSDTVSRRPSSHTIEASLHHYTTNPAPAVNETSAASWADQEAQPNRFPTESRYFGHGISWPLGGRILVSAQIAKQIEIEAGTMPELYTTCTWNPSNQGVMR
jgi:hypothetical protein